MPSLRRLSLALKSLSQLGFKQSGNYLLYQIGLRSGYFHLRTPMLDVNQLLSDEQLAPNWFLILPNKDQLLSTVKNRLEEVIKEADEIASGNIRLFGGDIKPLNLTPMQESQHWSAYERGSARYSVEDVKYTWEPARFNWAVTLAKAYFLSGDERYPAAFWQYFEKFIEANPVNRGPNWTSAQEVSLRMLALIVCGHAFLQATITTPQRLKALCISIADHAGRIPPTICYAKAQNNNHLLSEAVGLYGAALFLPNHPNAAQWREYGLRWFNQGIISQIADDGTYAQHSTNYHRMMLVLALWMQLFLDKENLSLEDAVLIKLAAAAQWLALHLDEISGQVPNLGHNDGSNILPLSTAAFNDYRPVVQAAQRAFRASPALQPGPWDDLCLWLDIPAQGEKTTPPTIGNRLEQLILGSPDNWAALYAVQFNSRPAHADQLHVDIWYKGINLAMDAGTFKYNAPPPWENALAATQVHNTLCINGQDQMSRAGKFLWLDWAQAQVEECSQKGITALQDGYTRLGWLHRRSLRPGKIRGWEIEDELLPLHTDMPAVSAVVNWLLPDWPFALVENGLELTSPVGKIGLRFSSLDATNDGQIEIFKAGQSLLSEEKNEKLGWYSPTYGVKMPALSVQYKIVQGAPIRVRSLFSLPREGG